MANVNKSQPRIITMPNKLKADGGYQYDAVEKRNSVMGTAKLDGYEFVAGQEELNFLGIAEGKWAAKNKIKRDLIAKGIDPSDARKMVRNDPATVALVKDKQADYKNKAKTNASNIWQGIKTVSMAVPRGAAESLIRINFRGKAKQLNDLKIKADSGDAAAKAKWDKVTTLWLKLGGNRTKFAEAAKDGSPKKAFLGVKKSSFDGQEYLNIAGIDDAAIGTWIATGSTIIASITSLVGVSSDEQGQPELPPATDPNTLAALAAAKDSPVDSDLFVMPTWAKVGIGVLTVGVTITTIALIVKHYKNKKG